jgi:hypothetical protein
MGTLVASSLRPDLTCVGEELDNVLDVEAIFSRDKHAPPALGLAAKLLASLAAGGEEDPLARALLARVEGCVHGRRPRMAGATRQVMLPGEPVLLASLLAHARLGRAALELAKLPPAVGGDEKAAEDALIETLAPAWHALFAVQLWALRRVQTERRWLDLVDEHGRDADACRRQLQDMDHSELDSLAARAAPSPPAGAASSPSSALSRDAVMERVLERLARADSSKDAAGQLLETLARALVNKARLLWEFAPSSGAQAPSMARALVKFFTRESLSAEQVKIELEARDGQARARATAYEMLAQVTTPSLV